jgi:hypothetical protein
MGLCKCDLSFGNTGRPNCVPIQGVIKKLIFVPTYKSDGTKNYVDPAVSIDQTFLNGKLRNADKNLRWYPFGEVKNVAEEKADPITESFNDQSIVKIAEGLKSFTGFKIKGTHTELKELNKFGCQKFSVYGVDENNTLIGVTIGTDGYLYPMPVDNNSLVLKIVPATDTTVQKLNIAFNYALSLQDDDIVIISGEDISADLVGAEGLVDLTATVVGVVTTTAFTVDLDTNFGSLAGKIKAENLTVSEFSLYNVTDSAAVVPSSVVETQAGRYVFTYSAQTSADVLRLTTTGVNYELTKTITIP